MGVTKYIIFGDGDEGQFYKLEDSLSDLNLQYYKTRGHTIAEISLIPEAKIKAMIKSQKLSKAKQEIKEKTARVKALQQEIEELEKDPKSQ